LKRCEWHASRCAAALTARHVIAPPRNTVRGHLGTKWWAAAAAPWPPLLLTLPNNTDEKSVLATKLWKKKSSSDYNQQNNEPVNYIHSQVNC
jgi:hypothetical protein